MGTMPHDTMGAGGGHSAASVAAMEPQVPHEAKSLTQPCVHQVCRQDDASPSTNLELLLPVSVAVLIAFSLTLSSADLQSYPAFQNPPLRSIPPLALSSVLRV